MPTAAFIDALYRHYYAEDEEKQTFQAPVRLARRLLRCLGRHFPKGQFRILEIGGGDGALAKHFADLHYAKSPGTKVEICEVELYRGQDVSSDSFELRFFQDIHDLEGRFDLVIANACFHQIPLLNEMLLHAFCSVRSGGYFFAATAYVLPLVRLSGGRIDTLFPFHVHDLGGPFWSSVVDTFGLPAHLLRSGPSIVETQIGRAPLRSLVAHALKLPARLELALRRPGAEPLWKGVGGWEVLLRFDGEYSR